MTIRSITLAAFAAMAAAQSTSNPSEDCPWFPDLSGRQWKHYQTYFGLAIGDRDGNPTFPEIVDYMNMIHPEENFNWMLDEYYVNQDDCYVDVMQRAEFFADYLVINQYSTDGRGLSSDELEKFLEEELFRKDAQSVAARILDVYSDSADDYITVTDLTRFFEEFMHADHILTGVFPDDIPDTWPFDGEIAEAIMTNEMSGFAKDGRPAEIADLVVALSAHSGPDIMALLKKYPFDFKWWNDIEFVTRYVVGSFVDDFHDLDEQSLAKFIEFVGVGPIDQDIIKQVIEQYSSTDCEFLTFNEQMSLVEDWFTGELQFTEIGDQLSSFEKIEEIVDQLQDEIERLKESFLN